MHVLLIYMQIHKDILYFFSLVCDVMTNDIFFSPLRNVFLYIEILRLSIDYRFLFYTFSSYRLSISIDSIDLCK